MDRSGGFLNPVEISAAVVELYFTGVAREEFGSVNVQSVVLHRPNDHRLLEAYRAAKLIDAMSTEAFVADALMLVEQYSGGSFRTADAARFECAERIEEVAHLCVMYYTYVLRGMSVIQRTPSEFVSAKLLETYDGEFSRAQVALRQLAIVHYEKKFAEANAPFRRATVLI